MTTKHLSQAISRQIDFGGRKKIMEEFEHTDAGLLANASFYMDYHFPLGDTLFEIPLLQIGDLEGYLKQQLAADSKKTRVLQTGPDSKRDLVIDYRGLVIKSAKKVILPPSLDHQIEGRRNVRQHRVLLEFINAHNFANQYHLPIVKPVGIIESLRMSEGVGTGEFYIMERFFEPLGDPHASEVTGRIYKRFLDKTEQAGFTYSPLSDKNAYIDLVVRTKKNGALTVLATDCPNFEPIRK